MASYLLPYSLMTIATLSGFNYTTHYQHPSNPSLPYILFTHGFPSSSYDWRHQVSFFSEKGYGIIAPDTLGYGDTDQPLEVGAYRVKSIVDSIVEVVDKVAGKEGKVMGVAHDWGADLQSRLANLYPDRLSSYTFLTPYIAPGSFNVTEINIETQKLLGYATLGYWEFFNASDAGPIIDSHKKHFANLLYPINMTVWKTSFAPVGAAQQFLTSGQDVKHAPYITDEEQKTHNKIFSKKGYTPSLGYYRASMAGYNDADEAAIPPANLKTTTPTLFIGAAGDPLLPLASSNQAMTAFNPGTVLMNVTAGHWSQLECRDEVNRMIEGFLDSVLQEGKKGGRKRRLV